jgi:AcrR family transcriptional regulator
VAEHEVIVLEDLNLRGMTKSAKGTIEEPGKNVAAKSGLNRVLAQAAPARVARWVAVKAESAGLGRRIWLVNPAHTSQRCSACGVIDATNRITRDTYYCGSCGHYQHADINAACNIRARGLAAERAWQEAGRPGLLRPKPRLRRRKEQPSQAASQAAEHQPSGAGTAPSSPRWRRGQKLSRVPNVGLVSPSSQAAEAPATGGLAEKRRAIMDAARRVFFANGFVETSVDAIAAAAGVSKQTIYNHFGDKRALFVAIIAAVQAEAAAAAADVPPVTETDDLEAGLRQVARLMIKTALVRDIVALRRIVIAERGRDPELLAAFARPRSAFDQIFADGIQERVRAGLLEVDDPDRATRQFLALTVQECLMRSELGTRELAPEEIEQIIDDGVTLWLRAYRVRG